MRIVCPDCQSAYDIKAEMLGDKGRMVKCADCGSKWFQAPLSQPGPAAEIAEANDPWAEVAEEEAAASASALAANSQAQPAAGDSLNDVRPAGPRLLRPAARTRPKTGKFPLSPALTAGAALLALLVLAIAFRTPLVRMQPNLAGLFAAIGLKVNTRGLAIEAVVPTVEVENGRRALVVSGTIRNLTRTGLDIPELRLAILDAGGKELAVLATIAPKPHLEAGASLPFSTRLAMPASAGDHFELRFARAASAKPPSTH